jgi:beta-glucosidase
MRLWLCVFICAACGDDAAPLTDLSFPADFRFGAATAATQIEDQNTATDWYLFTRPTADGGLGHGAAFVGDADRGYSLAIQDIDLLKQLHADSYRFSVEWARIEPVRGQIDETALAHYSQLIDALRAAGIRPLVTIHHFSNPVWLDDPRDPTCAHGPSDTNLCGLGGPGGAMVVQAFADHARLLAQRFGDRVDDWGTENEPVNWLLASYGIAQFPPGKSLVVQSLPSFAAVVRDYIAAHAAMYDAIKQADTIDADRDGVAANVGLSLSTAYWVASRDAKPSTKPADVAARERILYLFHHLYIDSILNGTWDANLDGTVDEQHPEWKGRLDWLGVQYYSRLGVTGSTNFGGIGFTPCYQPLDLGSCVPALDQTYCVPVMGYETYPQGLYDVLVDMGHRWPHLPLVVTEAGIATNVGERRAENVVRILESIAHARADGIDIRGYYHWSLMDNFEWIEGFRPHFGLYTVDYTSYARTPSLGAMVFGDIASAHQVTVAQRKQFGGTGPMTPEDGQDPMCTKLP